MKSKNTVLTRYFWDKMSTEAQNLQAELNALAQNPMFVASFIDDVSYILAGDVPDTVNIATLKGTQPEKPVEVVEKSVITAEEKQPEPTIEVVPEAEVVSLVAAEAMEMPKTVDHAGKVVVITAEKPSDAEISFLNKILAAVAVAPTTVLHIHQKFAARELSTFASAKIILSFGAVTDFEPDHQVRSKAITVIIAKSLAQLEQDLAAKKKLWESMKGFFK